MKIWLKILLGLILVGMLGAWAGYTFIYNKSHPDYENINADVSIKAKQLFEDFKNDTQTADENYTGKVIQVSGVLTNIEKANTLTIAVFTFDEGMFGSEGVRVTMLPNHAQNLINQAKAKEISLKGFCAGYNGTDVILENGSIIK